MFLALPLSPLLIQFPLPRFLWRVLDGGLILNLVVSIHGGMLVDAGFRDRYRLNGVYMWIDFEGVKLSLVPSLVGDMCLRSLLGLLIFTGNGVW